jgi:glycosyltransferase involved in cell wall biosynthesis
MQKKHILFVSYDGMTDSLGQSQVLPYIREISKKEYNYTLISFEKKERYNQHHNKIKQICKNSKIDWIPISYSGSIPIISTIWNVYRLKKEVFKLHKRRPIDLFHSRSHVPSLAAQALFLKKGVPFLFDMRGFWADERVDGKVWDLSNPIFKKVYTFFKRKEIEFLIDAGGVVSLTENGKEEILSWQHKQTTPKDLREKQLDISVIPCCVDTDLFDPSKVTFEQQEVLRNKLSIQTDQFVLGYVGSIGTWYMLPEMLDFFQVLEKNNPNAIFLFVSNERDKILELVTQKEINTDKIRIVSCLHNEVPNYISLFTVSIYFIIPAYSKKASSPTKQAELMSMGIPVVCNADVGDSDTIVLKTNSGWVVDEFDNMNYQEVVSKITQNHLPDKKSIIQHCKTEFNLTNGADNFKLMYVRILNQTKK